MLLNIFTKFHENILYGINVIAQTRFSLDIFERGIISKKTVGGVTILVLCTLFDTSFLPSFMKISLAVFKLYSGHNFHRKVLKGHNFVKKILME